MTRLKLVSTALLTLLTVLLVGALLHYKDPRAGDWSAVITAWATVALAVVTVWAVIYQTATADRVAQVQMLLAFTERYDSGALLEARRQLCSQFLKNEALNDGSADRVLDYFEQVAYFVRREHLRYEVVENEYSLALRVYWLRLKAYVAQMRIDYADPTFYENMEWLNDKFVNAYAGESGSRIEGAGITERQARGFFESEAR